MHLGSKAAAITDVREDPSPYLRLRCLCLQIRLAIRRRLSGENFHIRHGPRASRRTEAVDEHFPREPVHPERTKRRRLPFCRRAPTPDPTREVPATVVVEPWD